ncbi:MAG: MoaD family protein [Anaerolineae bacterium]|nr:MoaD family protein [Anaerolineae bacterium]
MKTIRLFATVRDVVGSKKLQVPFNGGGTVRDLIEVIRGESPALAAKLLDEHGELSTLVHIYVRGRNVEWLDGLDTVIADKDEVFIVPPIAGG